MKEKEVDYYLSLGTFCQIVVIGTGTAFFTEITKDHYSFEIVYLSGVGLICFGLGMLILYAKIHELIKK